MHAHSRFQSLDPFGQRRGSIPAADQKDRSSGNENDACWVQFSLQTLALGRTCLTGCVFTAFFFLTMPLLKSYVTWNNKGGVGKTTLTFHMATHYALTHPLETVLVIDLCPQANVSSALLRGTGNVARLTYERKTVSFYLHQVSSSYGLLTVNLQAFLTQVNGLNNQIPPNVYLLCGDIHLETVARSLEQKRNANLADDSFWVFVTSSVRYFIEGHFNNYEGKSFFTPGVACQPGDNRGWVVFIDTNPSFSVYTEIALLAAQRLIIPVNADDFSREALKSLLHLVYGIAEAELLPEFKLYDHKLTFSYKSKTNGLRLPLIYLLIHNRATRYNLRSAQAFYQLFTSSLDALQCAFKSNSKCFEPKPVLNPLLGPRVDQYFQDISDFHTDGIVALHHGCPLANLAHYFSLRRVPFLNGTVALNSQQIGIHLQYLKNLVAML